MERVIRTAARKGVDFADLRITDSTNTSIMVQDGLVDGAWGFAPTNNIAERQLLQALDDAIAMARTAAPSVTDPGMVAQVEPVEASVRTEYKIDPRHVPLKERVAARRKQRASRPATSWPTWWLPMATPSPPCTWPTPTGPTCRSRWYVAG